MKRRSFLKLVSSTGAAVALLPEHSLAQPEKAAGSPGASGARTSGTGKIPDFAKDMLHSDMNVKYGGALKAKRDPKEPYQMPLTKEEQAVLDGKEG
ncbi:MAG: twin-arginine translocation signal domain-containing protein, partial [Planctomycetota bacterium]